ncbi:MAG TPA: class I SAM-dependent methyltransferase [Thermohalobaculum sp.]|nr:class I SAM-dependent methyltransferase [Thermohalobaculum sp.]
MAAIDPATDPVALQYEHYPYPHRDPADEARRLIEGSPSHPVEIDHILHGGARDWSRPFRALVAGGGTGDGLIMLAQKLADMRTPAEITYLDLSRAARAIAEARATARGLASIRFVTAELGEAPGLGRFDYIDCCGVLHHLRDPEAGMRALAAALAPGGGIGLMVYAPHGRDGVYPLQAAFGTLLADDPPAERVRLARAALGRLAPTHPFARNPLVGDHRDGDAGLYDLLLHARDRPFRIGELFSALGRAGLAPVRLLEPARYEPERYLPADPAFAERARRLSPAARAGLAEDLAGNMKTHVVYAAPVVSAPRPATAGPDAVAHLRGVAADALAAEVARRGRLRLTLDGLSFTLPLPRPAARLIQSACRGGTLAQAAARLGLDWPSFLCEWAPVERALAGFNLLHYSRGARR